MLRSPGKSNRTPLTALTPLAVATLLAGAALVGAPATGAEPARSALAPDVAGVPPEQVEAFERDLGLTPEEIPARLALDASAAGLEEHFASSLGGDYAGTWVPESADEVRVAVTTRAAASAVRKTGAEAVVVPHGLDELTRWKEALDDVGAPRSVHAWYADPETNALVIEAADAGAARALADEAGVPSGVVRVEHSDTAPVPARDIVGGTEFHRPTGDGYVTLCSIGFAVAGGFVTAGHCGNTGDAVNASDGAALGNYAGSQFPGHDWAWVRTNSNWTPTPAVTNHAGGTAAVAGSNEMPIGASVCRSGRTTGWRCGVIQEKNVTINYGNGDIPGMATGSACAEGGDSGGSVISGDQAQGVTSGRIGDCATNGRFIYQPINPILANYNLSLTTTGGGGAGREIVGYEGKCIDVPNSNFTDGVPLQIWTCNGTAAQRWTFHSDGTVRAGGLCMDLAWGDPANGTTVQIVNCSGNVAQQWVLSGAGDLVSIAANKCVDVQGWNGNDGTKLVIWECHGGANQKWWLR
ncbi:ricin-type beta-trefoil lectin domain protein [Myceligenerans xiligouense]|uniref:Streptogrisin C n=1 Tax=Myceligenerans xiligouense TaxID=253184 RepID=A0A3N4Z227_9MICO|nr:ricin-type beta-trefoil lectin domain protein [Myceligenerans xiligouense]RPF20078.1 streptogrisin C [Myceligenerans xiligouense]